MIVIYIWTTILGKTRILPCDLGVFRSWMTMRARSRAELETQIDYKFFFKKKIILKIKNKNLFKLAECKIKHVFFILYCIYQGVDLE